MYHAGGQLAEAALNAARARSRAAVLLAAWARAQYQHPGDPDYLLALLPLAFALRAGNEWNVICACTVPTGARGVDGRSRWPSQRRV